MLNKSNNFNAILAKEHWSENKIIVSSESGRKEYDDSFICSLNTEQSLFGESYSIGNLIINCFNATLFDVLPEEIPFMSRVEVWTRITDGTMYSNWIPKGFYYTTDPKYDTESKILSIVGYDELYKAEAVPYANGSITAWEDVTTDDVVTEMSELLKIELEDISQIDTYSYPAPPYNYSIREILIDLAIASCGNWMLTYTNIGTEAEPLMKSYLRLCKINSESVVTDIGRKVNQFSKTDSVELVTHVIVDYGINENGITLSKEAFISEDTGRTLNLSVQTLPDGDVAQEIAYAVLSYYKDVVYQPFAASGVRLDPACEIGDTVICNGCRAVIGSLDTAYSIANFCYVEAPGIPHEDRFPYKSKTQKITERTARDTATNAAKISVNAGMIIAEIQRASDSEGKLSNTISQSASELTIKLTEQINQSQVDVTGTIQNHITEQSSYINYNATDGLTLGRSDDVIKANLKNNKLAFMNGSTDVAYISDSQMFIQFAVIRKQLDIGQWSLIQRTNGHLSLKWKG